MCYYCLNRQDFQKAFEFQKMYAEVDSGVIPILLFGDILRAQGRYPEAIPAYQQVLRVDPQSLHALGGLATCWTRLGSEFKAIVTFREILRLDSRNTFAQAFLDKYEQTQ